MKTAAILIFTLLFTYSVSAQKDKIDPLDTMSYSFSSMDGVADTLPNFSLFADETPMDLTLKYDVTSFIKDKMKGKYLDVELGVEYKDYTSTKNIRLKARGNNRREQCFFPPIYLNFKTDPIQNSELKGFRKVKLVTHCSGSKANVNYLLKEYLVYKLYNVLTDNSFRVKLLNIKYIDTGKKERDYERYGFLIEPIELLVKRTESVEVNGAVIQKENVFEADADVAALFQYMIGNTDWRIKGGHNTKYMKLLTDMTQKVIPIPYDFDFAGFVGTHYSHPQTWTSIETVQEREYLGYCRDNDEAYLETINLFLEKKDEILQTIKEFGYLTDRDRMKLTDYIQNFYYELNSPKRFLWTLKNQCRTDF